ncbi:MAG TPA: hydantoinase B/oxoprolinase family protein [Eoetvoesiella sp.]|jgi:N-methylhydantoinase B|uniref:hydantoinase B/oxoprolinase family protein n=1 Tax=Eoetvoesiella sp. TaxID=1966355 RepID=UPI002CE53757|nr:hydantoinase B/oxoprolinase family protein [Eoetvoesiella sp.]HWK59954.1 hydantoinase B/oxoprolinase family protein [Eoetvoesiella sp.]
MDPITFSIVRHRLFRVVEEAVITLKHVSGTAITNEGHDLMVSLYRADGSLLMGGVGFLHHLTSAAEACKAIIRRFEGQIEEGDVFMLNDPYTAALHTSDVYMLAPIHHEGTLVAWSACFVHVSDIGAMNPGGFAPDAGDIYSEGFSSPGLKLISRGELRRDIWDTFLNMVRSPEMVALDLRSLIACNNVAGERMLALIEKYGADTVDEVGRTLIEQSENLLRQRLLELPNGSWQSRQYVDVKGETSKILLTMTKQDDTLTFDFTGSSPQSAYSVNCTKWAALGGLFAPLFPLLCYDITWNQGAVAPIKMIAPEGSIVNCVRPAPVSVATVGAIQSVNNAACSAIGKMLAASEKYADEATAVWHANHFAVFMFGRTREGRLAIDTLTETFAGAGGAKTYGDGVDIGGEMPNPISRMANVETVEGAFPIRYLFRRRMRDSGGAGEYRGGLGGEIAIVPHGSPDGGINFVLSGKGSKFPMSDGLAGGGSGASNDYVLIKGAGEDSRRSGETDFESLRGERKPISWGVFPLAKGDAFYLRWNGGGGVGDALARSVEAVGADVVNGTISELAAKELYGVILKNGQVDMSATQDCRARLKAARMEQGAMA